MKNKPFLKWAGGKYKILPQIKQFFPKDAKRYIEPFVGAGAVALNVNYPEIIINDVNSDLINVWQEIRRKDFVEECKRYFTPENNTKERYNELRNEFNKTRNPVVFIYLNRHCFNGLCRYNSSGLFNVPFGKYTKPYFPRVEIDKARDKLFQIYNKDFREIFKIVKEGDLIYSDSPYLPLSKTSNFDAYSKGGFSTKDHEDLAKCAEEAVEKGATVVVSNCYNDDAKRIYKNAEINVLKVSRTISGEVSKRKPVEEMIAIYRRGNE
jgi:DNA adenine methylase